MIEKLDSMDLNELKALKKQLDRAIESFETHRRKTALEALEAVAKEQGFSLAELTGAVGNAPKSRERSAPKFANPHDPGEAWSGRGRKPRWYVEAIEAGKTPEDLAI